MNASIRIALPTVVLVLAACNRAPEPDPQAKPLSPVATAVASSTAPPNAAPAGPARELTWDAPARFTRVENPSSMRKATYKVKTVGSDASAPGEAPELAVSVAGGAVDANIDRWLGQFDAAAKSTLKQTTKKVGAWDVTIVELKGTFSGGGMPGAAAQGPKSGWALLAAIVPVDAEARWFFKMTGPEASVNAARADFDALVASVRPK